jgi:hypothetical protein
MPSCRLPDRILHHHNPRQLHRSLESKAEKRGRDEANDGKRKVGSEGFDVLFTDERRTMAPNKGRDQQGQNGNTYVVTKQFFFTPRILRITTIGDE